MGLATDTRLNALEQLLERTLAGLGYELADFSLSDHGRMLRVFIDKQSEQPAPVAGNTVGKVPSITPGPMVNLADCEAATRQLQRENWTPLPKVPPGCRSSGSSGPPCCPPPRMPSSSHTALGP